MAIVFKGLGGNFGNGNANYYIRVNMGGNIGIMEKKLETTII